MTRLEFLSCLLNKISKEIKFCKSNEDKQELKKYINLLKKHAKVELEFPDINLFQKNVEEQRRFYQLFERLPHRIEYKLESNSLNDVFVNDLKKFAYYLNSDHIDKVELIEKITKENPEQSKEKPNPFVILYKRICTNNISKLVTIIILLILIFYFVVYSYMGFEKNTVLISWVTLVGVSAYIIFKK